MKPWTLLVSVVTKQLQNLKDGSTFTVYYTTDVNVANKNYDYQFKTLPGLAVQYEIAKRQNEI